MSKSVAFCLTLSVLLFVAFASTASAGMQSKIDGLAVGPLLNRDVATRVVLPDVPLIDGRLETLVLEPFDVLAPGAVIQVHEDGEVRQIEPTPMRQYRGYVEGVPESLAYMSVTEKEVNGLVVIRDRKFVVSSHRRNRPDRGARRDHIFEGEIVIDELTSPDDFAIGAGYTCGTTGEMLRPEKGHVPSSLAMGVAPAAYTWPSGTATTMLNLVVDTDAAMYANWGTGASAAAIETFTRDLIGKAATIYLRDLRTDLRITLLNLNTSSDPWPTNPFSSGKSTVDALLEYGTWWHNNRAGMSRSAGVLLSGHYAGSTSSYSTGGVAWVNALCQPEGYMDPAHEPPPYGGNYWGPYAYCGGIGINSVDRTVPNPDANPNYAAPSSGYWALMQFAHELGHVVQSPHTHCVALQGADVTTYGRNHVDKCYSGEGGCFSGTTQLPADGAGGKGTIMSYCHINYGASNVRYTFGQAGEASSYITTAMRDRLDFHTPSGLSPITVPGTISGATSGAASVVSTGGLTYDWTITNGTITGGQGTNAITFTGSADPIRLRVTATNATGCAISDSATVSYSAASALPAPTGVVASATSTTSVFITWNAVTGAAKYHVWRTEGGGYTRVTPLEGVVTTSFTDSSALANRSYSYQVEASDGTTSSGLSRDDFATTVIFTDPTITPGTTRVSNIHFWELLTAVNAMRTLAGVEPIVFSDPDPGSSVTIRKAHIDELRSALTQARNIIQHPMSGEFTDATITAGSTAVKAAHVTELRNAVR